MLNVSTGTRHVFPRISYYFSMTASTHAGCKFIGSRWSASFWSHQLLSPTCVPTAEVQDSRNTRASESRLPTIPTTTKQFALFERSLYSSAEWTMRSARGDFINSASTEVHGNNAVKEVIEQNLAVSADGLSIEEMLEPCAEFVRERESWMIDGRFKVDVDTTDFGHIVGEVELTRTLQLCQ